MHEKRTIVTSKCFFFSEKCLNTRLFFSKKLPVFPELFTSSTSLTQKVRQRYCNWVFTAISRKAVAKNVHATIPKGNIYFFCCFPLALTKILPWLFVPFFQISVKNSSELKTTHNIFRDCRD